MGSCVRKACCCAELLEIVQTASWSLGCMGWIALGLDGSSRRAGETGRSTGCLTVSCSSNGHQCSVCHTGATSTRFALSLSLSLMFLG
jgi:hypothetical protein